MMAQQSSKKMKVKKMMEQLSSQMCRINTQGEEDSHEGDGEESSHDWMVM